MVAITPACLKALEAIRMERAEDRDRVFQLTPRQMTNRIKAACRAAGLEGDVFSGHSGRVGLARMMSGAGAPTETTMRQGPVGRAPRWSGGTPGRRRLALPCSGWTGGQNRRGHKASGPLAGRRREDPGSRCRKRREPTGVDLNSGWSSDFSPRRMGFKPLEFLRPTQRPPHPEKPRTSPPRGRRRAKDGLVAYRDQVQSSSLGRGSMRRA